MENEPVKMHWLAKCWPEKPTDGSIDWVYLVCLFMIFGLFGWFLIIKAPSGIVENMISGGGAPSHED